MFVKAEPLRRFYRCRVLVMMDVETFALCSKHSAYVILTNQMTKAGCVIECCVRNRLRQLSCKGWKQQTLSTSYTPPNTSKMMIWQFAVDLKTIK